MGHILAKILAKKKFFWPKFGPIFGPPGPPGTYFDPLYLAPISVRSVRSNQPQYSTKRPHFSTIFSICSSFSDPFPPFLPLISLKSDPGTHLKRTGTKFSVSWSQYDLRKRPRSNFMARSLIFVRSNFRPFLAPSSWLPRPLCLMTDQQLWLGT